MSVLENRTTSTALLQGQLKMSLYGPPGAGKTVFAGGAPNPWFLDSEQGSISLENHERTRGTTVIPCSDPEDVERFIVEAMRNPELLEDCETIVVDTLTDLYSKFLTMEVKKSYRLAPTRNPYMPEGGDYQATIERVNRIVRGIVDLGKHTVFISHDANKIDKETEVSYVRPQLSPKLADTLKAVCDIQCYLTIRHSKREGVIRKLYVHPTGAVEVKTRLDNLEAVIENPTFDDILKAKMGHHNG